MSSNPVNTTDLDDLLGGIVGTEHDASAPQAEAPAEQPAEPAPEPVADEPAAPKAKRARKPKAPKAEQPADDADDEAPVEPTGEAELDVREPDNHLVAPPEGKAEPALIEARALRSQAQAERDIALDDLATAQSRLRVAEADLAKAKSDLAERDAEVSVLLAGGSSPAPSKHKPDAAHPPVKQPLPGNLRFEAAATRLYSHLRKQPGLDAETSALLAAMAKAITG